MTEPVTLDDRYVPRPEFVLYCKSVNGDLADLKESMKNISLTLENRHRETRDDIRLTFANTEKALETSNANTEKALSLASINTEKALGLASINTEKALGLASKNTEKALEGTVNKSYAIIITILTGMMMTAVGLVIGLVFH